jgi:hypothetical protein
MLKAGEVRLPRARRMTLAGLTFVTFFTTCGGAFGIELSWAPSGQAGRSFCCS